MTWERPKDWPPLVACPCGCTTVAVRQVFDGSVQPKYERTCKGCGKERA